LRPLSTPRLAGVAACVLVVTCLGVSIWEARNLTFAPPDAEQHAIVARSLLRGEGYTENVVPFHAGVYPAIRHVPEFHGLLRPIVLVPLFAIFGVGPFAVHLPNLIYIALTGLTVYWWGARVFGRGAGLLACALTVLDAELLYYGLLATDDVGFAFFFTLTTALLYEALAHRRDALLVLAGTAGGLALLEKPSGFFVAVVFLTVVWRFGGATVVERARRLVLVFVPFAGAMSVYLARNYLAYGSPQFRFGVLVWIFKTEGYEGWNRIYDGLPSLPGMLRTIGWVRAGEVVADELGKFVATVFPFRGIATGRTAVSVGTLLPVVALGGVLVSRDHPLMRWLFVTAVGASVGFICIMWHFQMRYFSFLLPLFALWTAALVARIGRRSRAAGAIAGMLLVLASGLDFARSQRLVQRFPSLVACPRAIAWVAANVGPTERVLTFDPWSLAWLADRDAVMIPTGGAAPLAEIARRYDAHWLVAYESGLRPATSRAIMALDGDAAGLHLTRRFDERGCRVARVDWRDDTVAR